MCLIYDSINSKKFYNKIKNKKFVWVYKIVKQTDKGIHPPYVHTKSLYNVGYYKSDSRVKPYVDKVRKTKHGTYFFNGFHVFISKAEAEQQRMYFRRLGQYKVIKIRVSPLDFIGADIYDGTAVFKGGYFSKKAFLK